MEKKMETTIMGYYRGYIGVIYLDGGFAHSGLGTEEYLSVLRQHATSKDLVEHGKWAASHNRGTLRPGRRWGL